MSVETAMSVGAQRYSDVINMLRGIGLNANFTQTGGMCAALEVRLERGILLVTDIDDSLPWNRDDLRGWGVGYYLSEDVSDGPVVFEDEESSDLAALECAVKRCLRAVAGNRPEGSRG